MNLKDPVVYTDTCLYPLDPYRENSSYHYNIEMSFYFANILQIFYISQLSLKHRLF
nr:MAG TPA: hypothetical protein [Caudoviricetes sp.]